MPDDALLDALDRLRGAGPEFQGFLANHGPMAAEALTKIGGVEAIPAWVDGYRRRLQPAPEVVVGIAEENWRDHLGDERLIGDWTELIRRDAREMGWEALLLRWWPRLLPGMAASAAHGVIRTAHAVRTLRAAATELTAAPHPLLVDELAQGLAYWAARYQTLPGDPALLGSLRAVAAVRDLPRLDPGVPSDGPGLMGRLRSLTVLTSLPAALERWGPTPDPDAALDDLVAAASRVLAARDDSPIAFCHTVTTPAAVRMVLPVLPTQWRMPSVAATWQVVGGIVAAFAAPVQQAESRSEDIDPGPLLETLAPLAIDHGDEHVIKLSEAALREYARSGDATVLLAAERFRGRIPIGDA
jgi:hypothetical protein